MLPSRIPRDHKTLCRASLADKAAVPRLKEELGNKVEKESRLPAFSLPKSTALIQQKHQQQHSLLHLTANKPIYV